MGVGRRRRAGPYQAFHAAADVQGHLAADRPVAGTARASMTGSWGQMRQTTTPEVRLDHGEATGSDITQAMWRDLLLGIVAGVVSGVMSGLIVFWLLSRRAPRVEIVDVTQTDRLRIHVKNTRRAGLVLRDPAASAVQNSAELHIVSSILSDDPPYSRAVRFIRDNPLVIKPQATFVFVTRETKEMLDRRVEKIKNEWAIGDQNITNIGFRFRLFSRDGFSNTAEMVSKSWKV